MSNAAVETHPIMIFAPDLVGGNVVHRAGENPGEIVPQPALHAHAKDLCRRFVQKILNEGELSRIRDFMAPGVVTTRSPTR